ncbi:MAG: hypothetical protein ACFCA4_15490 [Cyanophyceae cyanobacterium]
MAIKILPSRRLELVVPASPTQVAQRLEGAIAPHPSGLAALRRVTKPFLGRSSDNGFEIRRRIDYRNSFIPIVTGQYAAIAQGTRITITMQIHPAVIVFVTLWSGIWFPVWTIFLLTPGEGLGELDRRFAVFALAMPIVGWVIIHRVFESEANQAEEFLRKRLLSRY